MIYFECYLTWQQRNFEDGKLACLSLNFVDVTTFYVLIWLTFIYTKKQPYQFLYQDGEKKAIFKWKLLTKMSPNFMFVAYSGSEIK